MSNTRKLRNGRGKAWSRLGTHPGRMFGDLADGLEDYAAALDRVAELVEKHAAGRTDIQVHEVIRGMPDGAERRELLALLPLVPEKIRRAGMRDG